MRVFQRDAIESSVGDKIAGAPTVPVELAVNDERIDDRTRTRQRRNAVTFGLTIENCEIVRSVISNNCRSTREN
jgi:hypothetical protein